MDIGEFGRFIECLKGSGIAHDIHWHPSKEEWQLDLLKLGYNITSLATTEVNVGSMAFLFMTGSGVFLCSRYENADATIVTRRTGPQLFLARDPQSLVGSETMLPRERLTEEDKKNAFVAEAEITRTEKEYGNGKNTKVELRGVYNSIEPDKIEWSALKAACKRAGVESNKILAYCLVEICKKNGLGTAKVRKKKDQYHVTITKDIAVK